MNKTDNQQPGGNMRIHLAIGLLVTLGLLINQSHAQERQRLIQIMSPAEFLKLPDSIQSMFIGGLLEGMAFTAYGMSWPDYPRWTECVRTKSLGDTTKEVVAFLKQEPGFQEGVASALAQALGKRCRKT